MKYLLVFVTLLGILPMAVLSSWSRWMQRILAAGLVLPLLAYERMAMNFFPIPDYRGTARGMEISLVYIVALGLLVGAEISGWTEKRHVWLFPGVGYIFYLVFVLLALCSFVQAQDPLISWLELWKLWMMALVFVAVWNHLRSGGSVHFIWDVLAFFTVVNFLWILYDKYLVGRHQARGCFPYPNSMGMFFACIGPFLLARLLDETHLLRRMAWTVSFGGTVLMVIWSYSRGSIIAFLIGCAITLVCSFVFHFHAQKLFQTGVICCVGICFFILTIPRIVQRFEGAPSASRLTRIYLAQLAVNMANSHLLGVGLNNWYIQAAVEDTPEHPEWKPHPEFHENIRYQGLEMEMQPRGIVESAFLLVAAECGWLALGAYLLWLLYYLVTAWRLLRPLADDDCFYIPCGAVGGLTACYMQTCLEWVLRQPMNFIVLMLIFSMLAYLQYASRLRSRAKALDARRMRQKAASQPARVGGASNPFATITD